MRIFVIYTETSTVVLRFIQLGSDDRSFDLRPNVSSVLSRSIFALRHRCSSGDMIRGRSEKALRGAVARHSRPPPRRPGGH